MTEGERLHKNVWVTSGTSFLTDVSSEMILNVLPLFLANILGVRVWAVGVVEGLANTTASVLNLYSGWLSDRLRARKWLAVAGYGVSALAKPFYYVAATWPAVAAIRWADRVGKGVRTAPRDALLADSTPPHRRGLAFGLHRAADTGGAVAGLVVASWVVAHTQGGSGRLLEEETFRHLVLWSLVPAFAGVLLLAASARDVETSARAPRAPRFRLGGLSGGFTAFVVCSVVFQLGNSADAFLVLRAQERGLTVLHVLWVLVGFNVVYAALATPAGSLADRVPRRRVVLASWCVYALAYAGFAVARTPVQVIGLYLLYGVYYGMVTGAAKALIADLVPVELRGTAYGTYTAAIGLISLPASLLAGVLWEGLGSWEGLGAWAPFACGAVLAGTASALLILTVPEGRPESHGA